MVDEINPNPAPVSPAPVIVETVEVTKSNLKLYSIVGLSIFVVILLVSSLVFVLVKNNGVKDYGTNFDGFVSAAKLCQPSKVLYNASIDLMGLRNDTYVYEIKLNGIKNNTCLFYTEIVDYISTGNKSELPPLSFFKMLNKTCSIPVEMIETEFEYWKSGSPKAFSNKSYCVYAEQVSLDVSEPQTNPTSNQSQTKTVFNRSQINNSAPQIIPSSP